MSETEIKTYRDIPQVEKILNDPSLSEYIEKYSRPLVARYVRAHIEKLRYKIKSGRSESLSNFLSGIKNDLEDLRFHLTSRVVNATGIVVHTNLGRTPLGEEVFEQLKHKVGGYSSLEFDLLKGTRGSRGAFLFELLSVLTGAEAGLAVNNNAAAVMLILNTFGLNRKVIVSRGEQVQIGGGFRMHEVALRSGVELVEVGATNRTVIDDYENAVDDQTAVLFKVHLSNFRQIGFTEETSIKELVELGRKTGLAVVHDLGSGALVDTSEYGLTREPTIHDSLAADVDLVCFSGDKLLGGPQAGIILGKKDKVEAVKKNPLYRACRLDKIIIAVLEELILKYMRANLIEIPLFRVLSADNSELKARAEKVKNELDKAGIKSEIIETEAFCGGGSLPEEAFQSLGLRLKPSGNPQKFSARLRHYSPPVVGRISDDNLILDLRTVFPEEDKILIEAVKQAWQN
jgi:L-seryl-tRNA(Ser) seleniumtransferase